MLASAPCSAPSEQHFAKGWSADHVLPLARVLPTYLVLLPSFLLSSPLRKHLFPDVVLEPNKRSERP